MAEQRAVSSENTFVSFVLDTEPSFTYSDYTHGILTTAVHLTPYLEQDELAMANCLLNTGVWRSLADFCYK